MINLIKTYKKQKDLEIGDILKRGDQYSIIVDIAKREDIGLIQHRESNPPGVLDYRAIFEKKYSKRNWEKKIAVYIPKPNQPKFQIID